jgi:ubiquitin carboxyl-terminal hydrolase 4/11/15
MNSGIQCISNTVELVQYLLDNKYKAEINLENPLGSKGRLISKLSNLVRKIWYDNKASIAPFSFKKTIGELQPQVPLALN